MIFHTTKIKILQLKGELLMFEKILSNNHVCIVGTIICPFTFSHTTFEEKFYTADLCVSRQSGAKDIVPLMASEEYLNSVRNYRSAAIAVTGQYRSYNLPNREKRQLSLWVFVRKITLISLGGHSERQDSNQIYLHGYLCKPPIFRQTPLGREISEILLAVRRAYGKTDYIPCICWYLNAQSAGALSAGDRCTVWGRIQSREYQKKMAAGQISTKTTYEVSVNKLELYPSAYYPHPTGI